MPEEYRSFAPVYQQGDHTLILGTAPSPASVRKSFYYGHAQNRFWPVLTALFGETRPASTEEKIALLHRHKLALWDVLESCNRVGAADATIVDAVPNQIAELLATCPSIKRVACNGAKAHELFLRHIQAPRDVAVYKLPSTSPANVAYNFEKLLAAWNIIGGVGQ